MSVNDHELLSAYIDSELTESERAALEARLQSEPQLQLELQSLQQTVSLVQQLPERRAPRNFTLNAALMRPARVLPFTLTATFSALSTAAAILLVAFGGYFLLQSNSLPMDDARFRQQAAQNAAPGAATGAIASLPTATAAPTQTIMRPATIPLTATSLEPFAQSAPAEGGGAAGTLTEEDRSELEAPSDSDTTGFFGADDETADADLFQRENEAQDQIAPPAPTSRDDNGIIGRSPIPTAVGPAMAFSTMPATASPERIVAGESNLQAGPPESEPSLDTEDGQETSAANDNLADLANEQPEQTAADQEGSAVIFESQTDNQGLLGIVLAAAGSIMLLVALITTILRRRSLNEWG